MEQDDKDILVKVEGLSKKFCKDLKTSLWYGVQDLFSVAVATGHTVLRNKEFWAVKEVSFELRRGECLGLIGHNGAGKSTLLKILNGLINPDDGKVIIKGRVGALIELGAGFNPILSGRENIYNNGAILGFSRKEIDTKLDEIIAFAELEDFIDMPVQHYSSGMKVRLGFAVAAQMEPDVLIIDEVLAVGDLGFVLKCFKVIDQLLPNTAIVFVSHNMPMVSRICNRIILMDHGKSIFQGNDVAKAIDLYYNKFVNIGRNLVFSDGSIELIESSFILPRELKNGIAQLNWNDDLKLYFKFRLNKPIEMPQFKIEISDKEQRAVAIFERNTLDSKLKIENNNIEFFVSHKSAQFSKGVYSMDIGAFKFKTQEPFLRINGIHSFQVVHEEEVWTPFLLNSVYETK
ncbi:ABC transporter ATP-binding protein [Mangrovimonas sp. DI 80]|uniref:ABC transporter ATP-binding protein n=1 Tax=Mangrovimonas sp. DI 80 TaxID=1779330 RepID=UPI000976C17E|nr:ABC transporter ATP-binding protein [Mangrovimonas sp. DI 80]OMP31156.1 ABC transporter [Mangrovimonas sp. DI 80]